MKKLFGFAMVVLCALCLTGCGSNVNKLKCTGTVNGVDATMTATLKGDKVTKIDIKSIMEMESEEEARNEAYMMNAVGLIRGEGVMEILAKVSGKSVIATATIDITKMSNDEIEEQFGPKGLTKDAFIKYAEGLTCK